MGRILPLLGLRAFAETGRHGGMKAAARVLGVTPGAVSQQVKTLEDRLGVALFERRNRVVHLTPIGVRLHSLVTKAFDQLERAVDIVEAEARQRTVVVSTTSSFAASWLVPRLGRFTAGHPECEVRVEAASGLVDFRRDRIDVAIRHGLGDYPGLATTKLFAPQLVPVGSPTLLANGPPIATAADCLAYPLLQDSERSDWRLWFAAHDVVDARAERGVSLEDDYLLLRAAIAGQGLALVRDIHAGDEIQAGRLAVAIDLPWPARFAYYVVTKLGTPLWPEVSQFVAWLMSEAAAAGGEPAAASITPLRTVAADA